MAYSNNSPINTRSARTRRARDVAWALSRLKHWLNSVGSKKSSVRDWSQLRLRQARHAVGLAEFPIERLRYSWCRENYRTVENGRDSMTTFARAQSRKRRSLAQPVTRPPQPSGRIANYAIKAPRGTPHIIVANMATDVREAQARREQRHCRAQQCTVPSVGRLRGNDVPFSTGAIPFSFFKLPMRRFTHETHIAVANSTCRRTFSSRG
jgi:hypothetical protein